ncbi:hypothetical protein EJ08DRAFT_580530, partial [Tothia fuscella]
EKYAYIRLKQLQGFVIPHYYGEALRDLMPASVMSVARGKELREGSLTRE